MAITVTGLKDFERDLTEVDHRVNRRSYAPVLETLGAAMQRAFLANLASGGSRLASVAPLPPMHPVTAAIRRYYGHEGKPRLRRGGDLQASIKSLGQTDRAVEVGSNLDFAHVLHEGGEVTDRRGRRHSVRPHRFLLSTIEDLEGYDAAIVHYFIDQPFGAAAHA